MTTTGQAKQPKDGPRRHRRLEPRDSPESAAGRMEQLADAGRSDSGQNDHATVMERADALVRCTGLRSRLTCAVAGAQAETLLKKKCIDSVYISCGLL